MTGTPTAEKVSPTGYDPRPSYFQLGTDTEGADHIYSTRTSTVLVINNQRVTHRIECEGHVIDDYTSHVEHQRGWQTLQYGRDAFFDRLAHVVEGQ